MQIEFKLRKMFSVTKYNSPNVYLKTLKEVVTR